MADPTLVAAERVCRTDRFVAATIEQYAEHCGRQDWQAAEALRLEVLAGVETYLDSISYLYHITGG